LFQTSFQVGGAVVLAIVTAVVDASGAGHLVSPAATLTAYRPALILITAVAAVGALVALSGLRRQRDLSVAPAGVADVRPADVAVWRNELAVPGELAASGRDEAGSGGELASCTAAPAALTVREPVRDSTVR
jgi:hypothetical protein